jgi:hypothetical protein
LIIIGAGMAGLLAAGMLRNECESILEAQSSLPNNHSAVLRFRSSIVGDTLNIPFRPVRVMKAIHAWRNPVADVLSYSRKANGTSSLRSIVAASGEIEERWIAPPDLVNRMAAQLPNGTIAFDIPVDASYFVGRKVISTIPMPSLMRILDYPHFKPDDFKSVEGININVKLAGSDTFATLYIPDPSLSFNRLSITGDRLTIEIAFPGVPSSHVEKTIEAEYAKGKLTLRDTVHSALDLLGLHTSAMVGVPEVSRQRYAKILPIDDDARKRFILWASEEFGVYSLGRFATWRPGLLLDDLVKDVRVIQKISRSGSYDHRR